MCKYFLVIILVMGIIVFGCLQPETMTDTPLFQNETTIGNDYFFNQDFCLIADITTSDVVAFESGASSSLDKTEQTSVIVYKVINMQNGSIYKLAIDPVENLDGYLNDARLNIYFYVTSDKIYRIWSYVYENDVIMSFYNDDNGLIHSLDSEEEVLCNSYLVCQQNAISDEKKHDDPGVRNIIEVNGNQITSRMWNVKQNGDTDFFERFEWESDRGLIAYRSGFGAGRDILYLNNMTLTPNQ